LKESRRPSVWDGHFDEASAALGDTEAANAYLSVRNFLQVRDAVLGLIGDLRGARVLDVGCGTGHLAQPLAGENSVAGVDLSSGMLHFAAAKGIAPVKASGSDLPFKDGHFDLVLATSVIQLIPDGEAFVRELVRVARPGGRIVITTINSRNMAIAVLRIVERKKYRHFRLYSIPELSRLADAAGADARRAALVYFPFGRTKRFSGGSEPGFPAGRLATSLIVEAVKRPG
jgi:ubiquinone/menaquinone biosynthesis C-methylase UbiE